MSAGYAEGVGDFLGGYVEFLGEFLGGGATLVFLLESGVGFVDFVEGAYLVEGEADDAGLLGEGLEDGLTDPPDGVGDEFEAAGFVEFLGGLDEAEVALVDEVGQAEALVLVLFGNGDDEAEVGPGEFLEGPLVTLADALGELDFLLDGDEFFLADFLQVLVQRGAFPVCY